MPLKLTTELDAVNTLLSIIGESPVNQVENTGVVDAVLAKQLLDETSREVQQQGWSWNVDTKYALAANTSGEIKTPATALNVDPSDPWTDYVNRGGRLWDRKNHTYNIGKTVKVDITWLLEFKDLPQAARYFITVRAGRKFQDRVVGSEVLNGFNASDERRAWIDLQNHEANVADYNMGRSSWSVGRIIARNGQPRSV